jgi:hypothetical protein
VPLGIVLLLLDITLIYHASKTGRLQPWAFIILMVPGIGGLAYIVVELVPEWVSGPSARQARRRMTYKLDPEKVYRELADHLAVSDTVANRAALADECMEIGRYEEAEQHYDHILTLPIGGEPVFGLGKARAQFARKRAADAIATLDDLQRRWPDFQSPEAHLLYARALGEAGRLEEALDQYHSVAEAKARYGSLLAMTGRTSEARVVFTELLVQMKRAPRHVRRAQAEWLSMAERGLSA